MTKSWNCDVALENADNDPSLLLQLLDIWLKQSPGFAQQLRDGAGRRNMKELCDATHVLKGSLQILGAESAIEKTARLEQAAKDGDVDSVLAQVEEAIESLSELQSEIRCLLSERTHSTDEMSTDERDASQSQTK